MFVFLNASPSNFFSKMGQALDSSLASGSEVEELNGKVQFSSKVHFYGELELNLVHFLAK